MYEKLKNKLKSSADTVIAFTGQVTGGFVSEQVSEIRYKNCLECENLSNVFSTCKLCGCHMPTKVKLQKAKCPIGKW